MVQITVIMAHFAFIKEIFFGIGDFFQWSFQFLPPIGIVANWICAFLVAGVLGYWMLRIIQAGKNDKRSVDYREPHNFID